MTLARTWTVRSAVEIRHWSGWTSQSPTRKLACHGWAEYPIFLSWTGWANCAERGAGGRKVGKVQEGFSGDFKTTPARCDSVAACLPARPLLHTHAGCRDDRLTGGVSCQASSTPVKRTTAAKPGARCERVTNARVGVVSHLYRRRLRARAVVRSLMEPRTGWRGEVPGAAFRVHRPARATVERTAGGARA